MSEDAGVKPGKKTSEHLMTYVMTAVSIAVGTILSLNLPEESPFVKVAVILVPILAAFGYNVSRGMVKMGKTVKVVAVVVVLGVVAGCCTVPAQALKQIEASHDLILPDYVRYVEADAGLSDDSKGDRKKAVASLKRLVDALKDHAED